MLFEAVKAFDAGRLNLPCLRMTITQEAVGDAETYAGPGFVRQDDKGRLVFQLFHASPTALPRRTTTISGGVGVDAGELYPAHHFYRLEAIDTSGDLWVAERVRINVEAARDGRVISGFLSQLIHEQPFNHDVAAVDIAISVPAGTEIPMNLWTRVDETTGWSGNSRQTIDAAEVVACGGKYIIRQTGAGLTVRGGPPGPPLPPGVSLPQFVVARLVEALEFVTGRSLWWSRATLQNDRRERTWLRSAVPPSDGRVQPPVHIRMTNRDNPGVNLLGRYLDFVWNHAEERPHPISAWLRTVRHAAAGSRFALGLALGVAIEGVVGSEFSDASVPTPGVEDLVAAGIAHVQGWEGDAQFKARIVGAVEQMSRVRAKDRLHELRRRGVITAAQIKAWDRVRNTAAHARPPEDDDMQRWIDACHTCLVMLYFLIFSRIGYAGQYADYSTRNWPVASYPSESPPAGTT